MACFLAEHNIPFNVADHLKNLIQNVCPDSKYAKELTFEKTKVQSIITNVTGKAAENQLISTLQRNKFSLIVDESTDKSKIKHLALIARTCIEFNVKDNFLCLIHITDGSATNLHKEITKYFNANNILYRKNMIGYASDGANVMFVKRHSLCSLFSEEIPQMHMPLISSVCIICL